MTRTKNKVIFEKEKQERGLRERELCGRGQVEADDEA